MQRRAGGKRRKGGRGGVPGVRHGHVAGGDTEGAVCIAVCGMIPGMRATKMNRSQTIPRSSRSGTAMPNIIRDVPPGHNWGWYSREDPRMHIQSTDGLHDYKVWLETRGQRGFEPEGKIPAKILKALQKEVA